MADRRLEAIAGRPSLVYEVGSLPTTVISLDGSTGFTVYTACSWLSPLPGTVDPITEIGTSIDDTTANTYSTFRTQANAAGDHYGWQLRRTGGVAINTPLIPASEPAATVLAWGLDALARQWLQALDGTVITDTTAMSYQSPTRLRIDASARHTHYCTVAYPGVHDATTRLLVRAWLARRYQLTPP